MRRTRNRFLVREVFSRRLATGNRAPGPESERRNIRAWTAVAGSALLVITVMALAAPARAHADLADEQALAERYAPVVRLVEQSHECGPGEPYEPTDVDLLFGNSTVALRGTWNATDLVKIAPTAKDIAGLYGYHLDYPGNALAPGCAYEHWVKRLTEDS